jgi:hypothetical protein
MAGRRSSEARSSPRNALIADNESGCGEPITSSFGLSDDGDCVAEGTTSNLVVNDAGLHELGEYGGGTETFALELGRRASTARRP